MTNTQVFLWNLLLSLAWAAITGSFGLGNLVVGFGVGFVILFVLRRYLGTPNFFVEVRHIVSLTAFVLWELVVANLRVARDVLSPRFGMRPGVIAVPLEARTAAEVTMLSNLISLTPGSLTLDVSSDLKYIFIHAMYVDDPEELAREVKDGFERRLLEVMR
jgi:multicomponent Na+:H+ antiporter subunit E